MTAPESDFLCPICGSTQVNAYRGRERARCASCGAFERSRLLHLVLQQVDLRGVHGDVLHLAPELGVARNLQGILGERYVACDINPAMYEGKGFRVRALNACHDLQSMETGSVGAVIHVHVLEHVRCNAAEVLRQFARVLSPGGFHIFGLPFMPGHYKEDLDPTLSEKHRLEVYGHEDHQRAFGVEDFDVMFGPALTEGMTQLNLRDLIGEVGLTRSAIPRQAMRGRSAHSILVYQKRA